MAQKQPNILFIMTDQLAGPALPIYGHPVVKTPNLSELAKNGMVFENAYCNQPICAPSRSSMISGQLTSRIGTFDNAAEFPASVPTFVHHLRCMGYQSCLSGKMHFVGPDQLHGFEERITPDVYPAGLDWTPDWERSLDQRFAWYHQSDSVREAGQCKVTMQIEYDDEVTFRAVRKIYDYVRSPDERPFFLMASFTHPHDPYAVTQEYWDRYEHDEINMPTVPRIPNDELDPHSHRLRQMYGMLGEDTVTEEMIRNSRHAYYAAISYIDDKVGELVKALKDCDLFDDTIIIFTSDHGDMLGERGLWYKMSFHEWSARVPLIFHGPQIQAGRVSENSSLVDLFPTIVELATESDGEAPPLADQIDGHSLAPFLKGDDASSWPDVALSEYLGEGVTSPELMIRRGSYKFIYNPEDPPLLFNLEADPNELENLATQSKYAEMVATFIEEVELRWDVTGLRAEIVASQKRRHLLAEALTTGKVTGWDFVPAPGTGNQYISSEVDLYNTEGLARYPLPS